MSGFPAPAARMKMDPVAVAGLGAAAGVPLVRNVGDNTPLRYLLSRSDNGSVPGVGQRGRVAPYKYLYGARVR